MILTKSLEGWHHDGKDKPALKLASLYVDQFNQHDIAREKCKKYNVPIFETIEQTAPVPWATYHADGSEGTNGTR